MTLEEKTLRSKLGGGYDTGGYMEEDTLEKRMPEDDDNVLARVTSTPP